MGAAAIAGGAAYGGGSLLNAYGEDRGLAAVSNAFKNEQDRQRGYDAQLQEKAQNLVNSSGIAANANTAGEQQLLQPLTAVAQNTAGAAANNLHMNDPEARGAITAAIHGVLAHALRQAGNDAKLGAFAQGGLQSDQRGRAFAVDRADIANRAHEWSQLFPLLQAAAGAQGGWARSTGSALQTVGKGLASYASSKPQPAAAPANGTPGKLASTPGNAGVVAGPPTDWQMQQGNAMVPSQWDLQPLYRGP